MCHSLRKLAWRKCMWRVKTNSLHLGDVREPLACRLFYLPSEIFFGLSQSAWIAAFPLLPPASQPLTWDALSQRGAPPLAAPLSVTAPSDLLHHSGVFPETLDTTPVHPRRKGIEKLRQHNAEVGGPDHTGTLSNQSSKFTFDNLGKYYIPPYPKCSYSHYGRSSYIQSIDASDSHASTIQVWAPPQMDNLAKQHFKCGNVLELCSRIAFAFYSRQPHIPFHPIWSQGCSATLERKATLERNAPLCTVETRTQFTLRVFALEGVSQWMYFNVQSMWQQQSCLCTLNVPTSKASLFRADEWYWPEHSHMLAACPLPQTPLIHCWLLSNPPHSCWIINLETVTRQPGTQWLGSPPHSC